MKTVSGPDGPAAVTTAPTGRGWPPRDAARARIGGDTHGRRSGAQTTMLLYAALGLAPLGMLAWALQLWNADLRVPFRYGGDTLYHLMLNKTVADTGWYLHNPFVGAPTSLDMHDYPFADGLNFLIIKVLTLLSGDYAVATNLFFLSTFPLAAIACGYALRGIGVSKPTAFVFAALYAFLPYHFFRGLTHLLLSAYYIVPLLTLVALLTWADRPAAVVAAPRSLRERLLSFLDGRSALICFAAGFTGLYYAFFGAYFMAVTGAGAAIATRSWRPVVRTVLCIGILGLGLLISASPTIAYVLEHGPNAQVARRSPVEAELYGLKIVQSVVPDPGHRFPLFAAVGQRYYGAGPPLVDVGWLSYLGFLGSVGFIVLVTLSVLRRPAGGPEIYGRLASLNLSAVLLATIGGVSSLFAMLVSPQIRAYDRISIYVALFAFMCLASLADSGIRWLRARRIPTVVVGLVLSGILVLGLVEQTSPRFVPMYAELERSYWGDRRFVASIEAQMPPGAMIFQLPFQPFPESGPIVGMQAYESFRGYLHSDSLRWSYGSMRGRDCGWHAQVAAEPIPALLARVQAAGFSGIWVDRRGYADQGAAVVDELSLTLGGPPTVSEDDDYVFFSFGAPDAFGGDASGQGQEAACRTQTVAL